jgi:hypothetical protein
MATVTHAFSCPLPDDPAPVLGEIQPSHWNDAHVITLTTADMIFSDPLYPTRQFVQDIIIRNAGQADEYIETVWTEL